MLCCTVSLILYSYVCMDFSGEGNAWTSLLARWFMATTVRHLISVSVLSFNKGEGFKWPTYSEILDTQKERIATRTPATHLNEDMWTFYDIIIRILTDTIANHLRSCIIAHIPTLGLGSHHESEAALRKNFCWSTPNFNVRSFVRGCIHCLFTSVDTPLLNGYGLFIHDAKQNALVQFDYLDLGTCIIAEKYILMFRDDYSSHVCLILFANSNTENTTYAIDDWSAIFEVPCGLIFDGLTHSQNRVVRLVTVSLCPQHLCYRATLGAMVQ